MRLDSKLQSIFDAFGKDVSNTELAWLAGLNPSHVRQLRAGKRSAKPATIANLRLALARMKARQVEAPIKDVALYRVVLALAALQLGLDPKAVQSSNSGTPNTSNKTWLQISVARNLAQYLMNCGLGIRQAEVARASGLTKQAVSLAMRKIEDRRDDDREFDDAVSKLEQMILGVEA